ncbi:DNA methyltransferase [Pelomicrobium methylotrophicum]|uniref:site-specific DNA-methyltransferase (cytosine-N(4)-specific) n=1 Tax=Pelomicrobium methylotrophicum TaxID=2602750 RepID=A0A5C7EUH4_9PROT|nr:DNA methyltransferase [Pelomicrobium methylotrophicum]TXF11878.1 DNA modification methylase [Pelomicrobium methylotrophicum]
MFPIEFPLHILRRWAQAGDMVLDPFCGRGTTNFAARLVGLESLGVDSSPVATAITASKLVKVTAEEIVAEAHRILEERTARHIPEGEFWRWAYHANVLDALCRFREAFLDECTTDARIALRGIILGALHGPKQKTFPSYFSNQCPRTYAPKPGYATRFWKSRGLVPESLDVLAVIGRRAKRYYGKVPEGTGTVRLADSRLADTLKPDNPNTRFRWVITSPPYYGMRTYLPDQWLRNWFLGGPDAVDYTNRDQVVHSNPEDFAADLRKVWRNAGNVSAEDAKMVIRFGGISSKRANPLDLIKHSLIDSGWRITTIREAGSATEGKRQADAFLRTKSKPMVEYNVWATRE